MASMSRRSVLGTTLGVAAAGTLGRPYIANAQAKTATVWVNQGFVPQEDAAFRKVAEDYMKESGNKLDYSIMPFMAQNQKTVSALTSGDVPDLIFMDAPATILPQNAWDNKIVDVSDIVSPSRVAAHRNRKAVLDLFQQGHEQKELLFVPRQAGMCAISYLGESG